MSHLILKDISFRRGDFHMKSVSLVLEKNSYFVLLGKTGSGKTQLLEAIAGLHIVKGDITLYSCDITNLAPERRDIGFVYQDFALFPNMSVEKNIRFSQQYKKHPKSEEFFTDIVSFLELDSILNRTIENLSGGEKQRVAIARAIFSRPKILLLDEPLSAIDPTFRISVMKSLKGLIQRYDLSIIHVTHNFREASYLADKIGIMENGQIIQQGSSEEVLNHPNSLKVAQFLGYKNILDASLLGSTTHKYASVDPNMIFLSSKKLDTEYSFRGKIEEVMGITDHYKVFVNVEDSKFFVKISKPYFEESVIVRDRDVFVGFSEKDVIYFGASNEE